MKYQTNESKSRNLTSFTIKLVSVLDDLSVRVRASSAPTTLSRFGTARINGSITIFLISVRSFHFTSSAELGRKCVVVIILFFT